MKFIAKIVFTSLLVISMNLTAHASEKAAVDEKPVRSEAAMVTIDATVESIDRETRQMSLKNEEGEIISFTLDEDAGRLDDINTGDRLSIKYLEVVTIQVFATDEIAPGTVTETVIAKTMPGEKPAALAVEQRSIVVTIVDIDLENELVTLKNKDGEVKTVSPKYPENLKKVIVGDQVEITYTTAVGFSITRTSDKK